jgi:hypothetical protein
MLGISHASVGSLGVWYAIGQLILKASDVADRVNKQAKLPLLFAVPLVQCSALFYGETVNTRFLCILLRDSRCS